MRLFSKFAFRELSVMTAALSFFSCQGFAAGEEGKDDKIKPAVLMFPSTSMPDRDWWQTLWPNPKDVVLSLGVQPSMSVIDLCCGDGYFTVPLSQVTSRVYGIELDADLLEQAQKEGSANKVENCRWIQGDAMNISSLVPEPVDYVLLANTLHGIPEKEALAKSVAAILKPEGQFAVINWHKIPREETTVLGLPRGPKTDMRMSPDQVNDILSPLGFVLREIVKLPPYHYGAIFKKLLKK
jgi:SAM-dependent methyltransferase